MKQPLDEFNELGGSNTTLDSHEPEFPLGAHGRDEVQAKPRSGAAHHRRPAFHRHVVPA